MTLSAGMRWNDICGSPIFAGVRSTAGQSKLLATRPTAASLMLLVRVFDHQEDQTGEDRRCKTEMTHLHKKGRNRRYGLRIDFEHIWLGVE